MLVLVLLSIIVRDHQKSAALKKHHLVGIQGLAECFQIFFESLDVGQQKWNNLGPSTIKGLVPDRGFKAVNFKPFVHFLQNVHFSLLESLVSHIFAQHVHFVNQAKNSGFWGKFCECVETVFKLLHVAPVEIFAGNIKNVNQHFNIFENMLPLALKKLLHKKVLASAIPQTEH